VGVQVVLSETSVQTREGAIDHRAKATIEVSADTIETSDDTDQPRRHRKPSVVLQFNICATTTLCFQLRVCSAVSERDRDAWPTKELEPEHHRIRRLLVVLTSFPLKISLDVCFVIFENVR